MEETALKAREEIKRKRREIEDAYHEIHKIAEALIPDYHFLDYKVATFWTCDDSPIGMCLFKLNKWGEPGGCRYCGGAEERK